MEIEENFLKNDTFPSQFKGQDVTKLPSFNQWKNAKKKENKEIVKCPICWGYEIFIEPTNHICENCGGKYCQKCLKICVEGEKIHDHTTSFCSKLCYLIDQIIKFGNGDNWGDPRDYLFATFIFLFGTNIMFTMKYFYFFKENKIIDSCTHGFFTYMNLFTNILYCLVFYIWYFELFFIIFSPSLICYKYFKIIMENWMIVIEDMDVGECPITDITVRGKGGYF